jgi:hypothetical protein
MAVTIHLRINADLVGLARVMRLLRRNAVVAAEVAMERLSGREVTNVRATMTMRGSVRGLAAALRRAPEVMHAVILDETRVLVEFSRGPLRP